MKRSALVILSLMMITALLAGCAGLSGVLPGLSSRGFSRAPSQAEMAGALREALETGAGQAAAELSRSGATVLVI